MILAESICMTKRPRTFARLHWMLPSLWRVSGRLLAMSPPSAPVAGAEPPAALRHAPVSCVNAFSDRPSFGHNDAAKQMDPTTMTMIR